MIRMYVYTAGDEKFVAIDGRDVMIPRFRDRRTTHALCLMNGLDGTLVLSNADEVDFRLEYRSKDGRETEPSQAARRCAVAFADLLGVRPFHTRDYSFSDIGGRHSACIQSHLGESKEVTIDSLLPESVICEGEFE